MAKLHPEGEMGFRLVVDDETTRSSGRQMATS